MIETRFKNTDIGKFPEDWKIGVVGDFFEVGSSKRVFQSQWRNAGIPFYRAREIVILAEKGKVDNELFIDCDLYEQYKRVYGIPQKDDLLVTGVGTLGVVYQVSDNTPFYYKDGNIICFHNKGAVSSDFVRYLYDFPIIKEQIGEGSGGSTVGTYTISSAIKTKLPVPPKSEQTRIATALSTIDNLISELEKLIEKKRAIKQGAMQQLLTGKRRLDGFSEPWKEMKLGDISKVYDGTHQTPHYVEYGIPFYSVENVTANDFEHTKYISEQEHRMLSSRVKIDKGDILMTRIGSIGDCRYVDWNVNASFYVSLALIKCNDSVDARFISYYSNSKQFKREIEMRSLFMAIPQKINLGPISDIVIVIPSSKTEQSAIASILSTMDDEIANLETKRDKYIAIKQGMMQQLLTGKIRLI